MKSQVRRALRVKGDATSDPYAEDLEASVELYLRSKAEDFDVTKNIQVLHPAYLLDFVEDRKRLFYLEILFHQILINSHLAYFRYIQPDLVVWLWLLLYIGVKLALVYGSLARLIKEIYYPMLSNR